MGHVAAVGPCVAAGLRSGRVGGVGAAVDAAGVGRLPGEIESAVYFCCLEALQNAAKHAGADARAHARLAIDEGGGLEIEIRDDGVGFDPAAPAPGAGLTNMRDRVAACGGTLTIESAHALAGTLELGRELGPEATILVNLSGRGDKDMTTAAHYFGLMDQGAVQS